MFAKLAAALTIAISVLSASAIPVTSTGLVVRGGSHSFDNYGGISSFNGFDNFYGSDNFDNSHFSESSITVVKEQEQEVVCHSESIVIIQQRLLVLQEMAKRIISEQICEVETQTVVFEQFHSSLHGFSRDLRRFSGRDVGYDSDISSHFSNFYGSDGSLSTDDWGFSGSDLGHSYVVPSGNNWDSSRSFGSVGNAYKAARSADGNIFQPEGSSLMKGNAIQLGSDHTAFASPMARYRRDTSTGMFLARRYQLKDEVTDVDRYLVSSSSRNISFNNWGGLSSLSGFDNFFGSDNFDGSRNQEIIIVEQEQVCRRQDVVIIQQQLSIVQEFAKQIILQQICDVETQFILLEQFQSRLFQFKRDISRQSGRSVSFDSNIAILILQLLNSDGSLNNRNLGFEGRDIGQHSRVISGSNWDDSRSPQSLFKLQAILQLQNL
ncbi:hypothetical protein CVT25_012316 [Psilocybe cyanescens]|uniref:Uncharacterized protein n=1 Tax=Psilocybe cyanescens TaxID=93625 RepID=A0A409VQV8_PSICY|nr:hypothetical protein CVT25_012316 [Psilocybe cyanescens]